MITGLEFQRVRKKSFVLTDFFLFLQSYRGLKVFPYQYLHLQIMPLTWSCSPEKAYVLMTSV
jgi:hypothetical protein